MIRAFVALTPPEDVAASLVAAQAGLPAGRAVEREALHLTLAFLGEHPEPILEDVHYALSAIRGPRFELRLEGLGMFGEGKPRVVYAGVAPEPALGRLREKVVQAARGAGLELERNRFRPHVTLARLGGKPDPEDFERLRAFTARGAGFRAGPFTVERFELMRSRLGRAGATYEPLASYELEPSGAA